MFKWLTKIVKSFTKYFKSVFYDNGSGDNAKNLNESQNTTNNTNKKDTDGRIDVGIDNLTINSHLSSWIGQEGISSLLVDKKNNNVLFEKHNDNGMEFKFNLKLSNVKKDKLSEIKDISNVTKTNGKIIYTPKDEISKQKFNELCIGLFFKSSDLKSQKANGTPSSTSFLNR
jgi:hypothetical protein